jgi:Zn-dependent protease with chaperone function
MRFFSGHFISIHFVMIFGSLVLAWVLRCIWQSSNDTQINGSINGSTNESINWQQRWHRALVSFVLPPLLVLMTAISVLCMGANGQMIGFQSGKLSYAIALIFLIYSLLRSWQLALDGWQSLRKLNDLVVDLPPENLLSKPVKLLNIPMLFAAQIGFWRSQLFISQGLIDRLDPSHLEAVLLHEQAHAYYRDTFWFFWLGCLRQVMSWLPNTQTLWEELLLLRELRADRWAAQHTDGLLLSESLLMMVSGNTQSEIFTAAFGATIGSDRLEERINFLLADPLPLPRFSWRSILWICFSLIPLTALPFHY